MPTPRKCLILKSLPVMFAITATTYDLTTITASNSNYNYCK